MCLPMGPQPEEPPLDAPMWTPDPDVLPYESSVPNPNESCDLLMRAVSI